MQHPTPWSPSSWRDYPVRQQPHYADQLLLDKIIKDISELPPLVSHSEVEGLRSRLAAAATGAAFVLQGGDCAERFLDCAPEVTARKLQLIERMAQTLESAADADVVRIGRIAGQYAKPRSADFELNNGIEIPCFRGDNIHSFQASSEARQPDPERLRLGYHFSALTRSYIGSWTRQHGSGSPVYSSHEGLLLAYEEALTRAVPGLGGYYNSGAHMLWIGDRTRGLRDAHVEYFRGIANPVGVKVSADADAQEIVALCRILNPSNIAGKILLITRMGASRVNATLPRLIGAVESSRSHVVWMVDPMHGNLVKTKDNVKTRDFAHMVAELRATFAIHQQMGAVLAGVHLEMTGDDVTECVGGRDDIRPEDLLRNYQTYCDPRLNRSQAIEIAQLVAELCVASRKPVPSRFNAPSYETSVSSLSSSQI